MTSKKSKIVYGPIDKIELTNISDDMIDAPTQEDREWHKTTGKKLGDVAFESETIRQIRAGNTRRVLWLLAQKRKVVDNSFSPPHKYGVPVNPNIQKYITFMLGSLGEHLEPSATTPHKDIFSLLTKVALERNSITARKLVQETMEAGRENLVPEILKSHSALADLLEDWLYESRPDLVLRGLSFISESHVSPNTVDSLRQLASRAMAKSEVDVYTFIFECFSERVFEKAPRGQKLPSLIYDVAKLAGKDEKLLNLAIENGASKDLLFFWAVYQHNFDLADKLVQDYGADYKLYAQDLITQDLSSYSGQKCKAITYLKRYKDIDMKRAIEYAQNPYSQADPGKIKTLKGLFGIRAVKEEKVEWSIEGPSSIEKTTRSASTIVKWYFYFDEMEQMATRQVFDKNGNFRDSRTFQFGELENQNAIHEAAKKLKDLGGDPGNVYAKQAVAPPLTRKVTQGGL